VALQELIASGDFSASRRIAARIGLGWLIARSPA